jgi:hypothetical protein
MSDAQSSTDKPLVSIGTSSIRQRYLFAFASHREVSEYLRIQITPEERHKVPEILQAWADAQPRIQALIAAEPLLHETNAIEAAPDDHQEEISKLLDGDLIKKSFLQYSVGVIEIDKLIAPQRAVNLEHIEKLTREFPSNLDFLSIARICLSSDRNLAPIQHLELGPNAHSFSSPSADLRFLGAFIKDELDKDDLAFAQHGGVPAAAIICFIGYGTYPVNVIASGPRIVLNNGFHRLYALRSAGIQKVPVIIQRADNPQLEFPPNVAGVPREYLLMHPRPVLMKDFFDDNFATEIRVRNRMRVVTLQVQAGQHDVPA